MALFPGTKNLSISLFTAGCLLLSMRTKAQDGLSGLIKSGPGDATKLAQAYAEPLFKGFGVGMNGGWNNTAKTKNFLKFEVRVSATMVFTPSAYQTFDVTQIGLSNNIRPADPARTIAPTIVGSNANGPVMNVYDNNGNRIDYFTMPNRKIAITPAPQLQATLGILNNTDVTLRAMPKVNFGSDVGSVSMIGAGIKHNIIQDFAGKTAGKLIPFDLAVALGFTHMNYSMPLTVTPGNGATPKDAQQSTDFNNQRIDGHFNGFNAQLIFSKKLLAFTPFVALGYNTAKTNVGLMGNYPITTGINNIVQQNPTYTTFTNPISISETSISGARADVGFQLNLGLFRFYASYGTSKYNTGDDIINKNHSAWAQSVNAGIGVGL